MNDFGHYLRIRYGLAPSEPTTEQLESILADIGRFGSDNGREPTIDELGVIVAKHCATAGTWKYAADVNIELRRQLARLATQAKSK